MALGNETLLNISKPLPTDTGLLPEATVLPVWEFILIASVNCLTSVVGTFANGIIIGAFFLCTSQRETTALLLISLSFADLLICSVYEPIFIHQFLSTRQLDGLYKSVQSFLGYGLMTASLNGLFTVAADRFIAIYLPFKYVQWMTEKNAIRLITAGWCIALLTSVCVTLSSQVTQHIIHAYITLILLVIPVMYFTIWWKAGKQEKRLRKFLQPPQPIPSAEDNLIPEVQPLDCPPKQTDHLQPAESLGCLPQQTDLVLQPAESLGRPPQKVDLVLHPAKLAWPKHSLVRPPERLTHSP